MSTKRCAYRGCGSYSNPSHPSPETFYSFPKDPERCKRWLKLGGCREQIPYTMRYFCSKHFDETKYVAHNQRRKQLLSTAIPWPYDQSPQSEITSDEIDFQCVESTIEDNEDEDGNLERFNDDAVSVEVANDITNISDTIEDALQNYEYHDDSGANEFTISLPTEKKSLKRKLESLSKPTVPQSEVLESSLPSQDITSNRATSSSAIATDNEDEHARQLKLIEELEESMMMESSNLTTFIFKGQEYIQMPKDEYVSEKMALVHKIRSYEELLKNLKQLMDGVSI